MVGKEIADLAKEEREIEKDLRRCEETLENIGSLAIRVQSFARAVSALDVDDPDAERLSRQADLFNKAVLRLGSQRSRMRSEEREEMIKSRINVENEYLENTSTPHPVNDDDFFSSSTQRINSVLMNAMDAFETVKRQGVYIDRTGERIRTGLSRIGLSKELIDQIDRRYMSDKAIFMGAIAAVVFLFFVLRFFL